MKKLNLIITLISIFIKLFALTGSKIDNSVGAIYIPQKMFSYVDYFKFTSTFDSLNLNYFTFSSKMDTCISETFEKIVPHISIDSIKISDFDYLIILGGKGILNEIENKKLLKLIKECDQNKKFIIAIGFAPVLLVKANVTDGKYVTMTDTYVLYEKVKDKKFKYIDRDIVSSKNLITTQTNNNLDLLIKKFFEIYNGTFDSKSSGK
ncbi:MAG: DJ-1/PfpI family protein [candidate division WOR-3 bacterium]